DGPAQHVDEAGRNRLARGVDDAVRRVATRLADVHDAIAVHDDVADVTLAPRAIEDGAATHDEIVTGRFDRRLRGASGQQNNQQAGQAHGWTSGHHELAANIVLSNGMPKAPSAPDAELIAEVERQLANTRESMAHLRARRDETRAYNQQRGDAHLALSNFTSHGSQHLDSGLVEFKLHADFAAATREFAAIGDWFVFYDDILAAAQRGELASLKPKLPLRSLLEPVLCLVLANDRAKLARLVGPELEQIFELPGAVKG